MAIGATYASGAAAGQARSPDGLDPGSAPATHPLAIRGHRPGLAARRDGRPRRPRRRGRGGELGRPVRHGPRQVKHSPAIAALEAGIPDAGALIFAALGIALALHGRRALRPRALNVACVAISLAMNAMAAERGWRDMAIWVMPAAVYALASDTLIGVVRAWALARMQATGQALAGEEVTPLAVAGRVPAVAAAPGAGTGQHAGRVPPLGGRGMPRRPGPQGLATQPAQPGPAGPAPASPTEHACRAAGALTAGRASRTC